jgi:hypothetical protein
MSIMLILPSFVRMERRRPNGSGASRERLTANYNPTSCARLSLGRHLPVLQNKNPAFLAANIDGPPRIDERLNMINVFTLAERFGAEFDWMRAVKSSCEDLSLPC